MSATQFNNVTALHQLTKNWLKSKSSNDMTTDIRPKGKKILWILLYLHKANDVILNSEQTRKTGWPYTQVLYRPVSSTKHADIFVLVKDRDFNAEIRSLIFCLSPLQLSRTIYFPWFIYNNFSFKSLADIPVESTPAAWSWIMLCNKEITTMLAKTTVLVFASQHK